MSLVMRRSGAAFRWPLLTALLVWLLGLAGSAHAESALRVPVPAVFGKIDAAVVDGMLFLLGERGLQVFDPRTGRILESVDVDPRRRLAAWGRHLVTLDETSLQVVDATPWLRAVAPAAPAR